MATVRVRADAAAVPDIKRITAITPGTVTLTINGKDLVHQTGAGDLFSELAAAVSASAIPEFQELQATTNAQGASPATYMELTPQEVGQPFTMTSAGVTVVPQSTPTGPRDAANPDNYQPAGLPAANDDLVFDSGSGDVLYNLDALNAITGLKFSSEPGWSGSMGLPTWNARGYLEYRQTHLQLNAASVSINSPQSTLIQLDLGTSTPDINVIAAGSSSTNSQSVILMGTAINSVNVISGNVGLGSRLTDVTTVGTVTIGNQAGTSVIAGPGATVDNWVVNGGTFETENNIVSLTQNGGDGTISKSADTPTLKIRGGVCRCNSNGNIGNTEIVISGDGDLNFDGDGRAKTLGSAVKLYGDQATLTDSNKSLTRPYDIELHETIVGGEQLTIGRHIRMTVNDLP